MKKKLLKFVVCHWGETPEIKKEERRIARLERKGENRK